MAALNKKKKQKTQVKKINKNQQGEQNIFSSTSEDNLKYLFI